MIFFLFCFYNSNLIVSAAVFTPAVFPAFKVVRIVLQKLLPQIKAESNYELILNVFRRGEKKISKNARNVPLALRTASAVTLSLCNPNIKYVIKRFEETTLTLKAAVIVLYEKRRSLAS